MANVRPAHRRPAAGNIAAMPEVVVVGASVAGAATAIHLARRGRDVLLLDRSEFPRRKPCGEGLFPAGVRQLRELGLLERLDGATVIESLRFHGYGATAEAGLGSPDAPAIGVRRSILDHVLLRAAAEAGARVALGGGPSQLQVEEDGSFSLLSEHKAIAGPAMIVAADGLGSGLRRAAGLDPKRRGRRYGVTAHVELRKPPEPAVEVHFRPGFEVYVTPVGGRCVNVALLMSKPMTKLLAGAPDGAMEELLHRESCLAAGWRLLDAPLVAGPFPVRPRRLWKRNLVLAGDAAGFFDGITGEGMSLALIIGAGLRGGSRRLLERRQDERFSRIRAEAESVGEELRAAGKADADAVGQTVDGTAGDQGVGPPRGRFHAHGGGQQRRAGVAKPAAAGPAGASAGLNDAGDEAGLAGEMVVVAGKTGEQRLLVANAEGQEDGIGESGADGQTPQAKGGGQAEQLDRDDRVIRVAHVGVGAAGLDKRVGRYGATRVPAPAQRRKHPGAQALSQEQGQEPGQARPRRTGEQRAANYRRMERHDQGESAAADGAFFGSLRGRDVASGIGQLGHAGGGHAGADDGAGQQRRTSRSSIEMPGPKAAITPQPPGADSSAK